ncbi:MAG: hypothetical protein GWN84_26370 [Gammaproteobacteria bacterium]|nr:hypothetical protein [Gammaproteobacteria bacterium]NIR85924.1 hypothetical protein [Gammaproteobacteria bacterium]NIR91916.1 hypothetical protein [Gammaproteobacteria bacterium]NIU07173.1 hypothetical protein [Gammaproteobacteria bacterium]NIV53986.1 hypothetical protein [Gammaproteobacteria bacterium]
MAPKAATELGSPEEEIVGENVVTRRDLRLPVPMRYRRRASHRARTQVGISETEFRNACLDTP